MPFYVTTPIYYVNAAPHLGHAYTTIAADVTARHHRQRAEEVFFLTGTDEHGEPVADAAHALGVDPQQLADKNAERFKSLAPQIGASNDFFIRTTDRQHEARVQEVLAQVNDNGFVYKGTYEGWYCPRCADFKADTEIDPGNRCPIHHIELTREQEDNYFFKLSAFQQPLERLYAERGDFVAPRTRYNEALSFIRSGLRDVPLTRHKLSWGVRVPWDQEHVFYVWFDALLNYYSALSYAREQDLTAKFWPASYHLIGKDILRFHAVYWPALLMAAEIELPRHIFVHGYLLMEGEKMSKSLGNVLDPFTVIERFGADALRFYLLREVPFGQDGSVSTASWTSSSWSMSPTASWKFVCTWACAPGVPYTKRGVEPSRTMTAFSVWTGRLRGASAFGDRGSSEKPVSRLLRRMPVPGTTVAAPKRLNTLSMSETALPSRSTTAR